MNQKGGLENMLARELMQESALHYEQWEAYALEHLRCKDCDVTLQKITPGEYYCPSCGLKAEV